MNRFHVCNLDILACERYVSRLHVSVYVNRFHVCNLDILACERYVSRLHVSHSECLCEQVSCL